MFYWFDSFPEYASGVDAAIVKTRPKDGKASKRLGG
jgi:hypothetical protein